MARRRRRRRDGGEFFAQWSLEADVLPAAAAGGMAAIGLYALLRALAGQRCYLVDDDAPTLGELAALARTDVKTVRRYLGKLEAAGVVEVPSRPVPDPYTGRVRRPGRKHAIALPLALRDVGRKYQGEGEEVPTTSGDVPGKVGPAALPAHVHSQIPTKEPKGQLRPEKGPWRKGRRMRLREGPADDAFLAHQRRTIERQRAEVHQKIAAEEAEARAAEVRKRQRAADAALVAFAPLGFDPERDAELALADQLEEESGRLGPEEIELLSRAEGSA